MCSHDHFAYLKMQLFPKIICKHNLETKKWACLYICMNICSIFLMDLGLPGLYVGLCQIIVVCFLWNVVWDVMKTAWVRRQKWIQTLCKKNGISLDWLKRHDATSLSWGCSSQRAILAPTWLQENKSSSQFHLSPPKKWLQVAQRRICKTSFQTEHHPSRYMLSQNIMPLLLGYQFCSCWKRREKEQGYTGRHINGACHARWSS